MKIVKRQHSSITASLTVATLLCLIPGLRGQAVPDAVNGAVNGIVTEPSGIGIAGAEVTIQNMDTQNTDTQQALTAQTDPDGHYSLSPLPPGRYRLQITRAGFTEAVQPDITLPEGRMLTLDVVLSPSDSRVDSPVDSRAEATGNRISEDQLAGLPLNGRSYSQLATLQAGVSDSSASSASRGIGGGSLSMAGSRPNINNYLLDGTNLMDAVNSPPSSAAGVQLGSDAILQVQVLSSSYGAEYGRTSGGVLNSITRSGSNEFHGTLFEYLRNSKLDARNFFDQGEPPPSRETSLDSRSPDPSTGTALFSWASSRGCATGFRPPTSVFFPTRTPETEPSGPRTSREIRRRSWWTCMSR